MSIGRRGRGCGLRVRGGAGCWGWGRGGEGGRWSGGWWGLWWGLWLLLGGCFRRCVLFGGVFFRLWRDRGWFLRDKWFACVAGVECWVLALSKMECLRWVSSDWIVTRFDYVDIRICSPRSVPQTVTTCVNKSAPTWNNADVTEINRPPVLYARYDQMQRKTMGESSRFVIVTATKYTLPVGPTS